MESDALRKYEQLTISEDCGEKKETSNSGSFDARSRETGEGAISQRMHTRSNPSEQCGDSSSNSFLGSASSQYTMGASRDSKSRSSGLPKAVDVHPKDDTSDPGNVENLPQPENLEKARSNPPNPRNTPDSNPQNALPQNPQNPPPQNSPPQNPPPQNPPPQNPQNPHPRGAALDVEVCIVGAGIAGLRTAQALLEAGVARQSVVVVEAQARVGGRIYTERARSKVGAAYDLGAAWFHDSLTNSLIHHLEQQGLWSVGDGVFDDADPAYFAREAHGALDVAGLRLNRVVEEMERWVEIMYRDSLDAPDMSLARAARQYLVERAPWLTAPQLQYCGRMVRALELWHGASHRAISARHAFLDYDGRHLFNRAGYDRVVAHVAAGVPVVLGEAVHLIERDVGAGVRRGGNGGRRHVVHCATRTVCADYVVVAVPHSVLALAPEHAHALRFAPPLPRAMAASFGALHTGALGKVVLEFSGVWWPDGDSFEVMADEDEVIASTDTGTPASLPRPFQYPISVVNYARHGAPALVVQVSSPVTEYLEAAPARAWPYLKPMLSKLAAGAVPDPINVIVSDWTVNPYIRGSYTAVHVGDDPYDSLLHVSGDHPSCGLGASTVRFAGDHTVGDGNGCVHGAFDSGARAAAWILRHRSDTERAQ